MVQSATLPKFNEMVSTFNINELRTILRDMGFSVHGTRDQLQQRLIDSVSPSSSGGKAIKLLIMETVSLLYARKNAPGMVTHLNTSTDASKSVDKSVHNIAQRYADLTSVMTNQPVSVHNNRNILINSHNTLNGQTSQNSLSNTCQNHEFSQETPYIRTIAPSGVTNWNAAPSPVTSSITPMQQQVGCGVHPSNATTFPVSTTGVHAYRNMIIDQNPTHTPYNINCNMSTDSMKKIFCLNQCVNQPRNNIVQQPNPFRPPITPGGSPPQSTNSQLPSKIYYNKRNMSNQCPPVMNQFSRSQPPKSFSVTFYQSPFYMIEEYIHPYQQFPNVVTVDDNLSGGKQCLKSTIIFNLREFANVIKNEKRPKLRGHIGNLLIQLRLFTIDSNNPQSLIEDSYPMRLVVEVNKRSVHIPGSFVNPDKEPRKPHVPLIITDFLSLSPSTNNTITVEYIKPSKNFVYYYAIVAVRKIDTNYLISNVCSRPRISSTVTLNYLKKQLFADNENDLNIVKDGICNRVSLLCPLSMTRIRIPIRHAACQHFQCFDLESYVTMNDLRPTWQCPICDIKAYFHFIAIDNFFENVLKTVPANCTHIIFNPDMTYNVALEAKIEDKLKENEIMTASYQKKKNCEKPCLIVIDDDDDSNNNVPTKPVKRKSISLSNNDYSPSQALLSTVRDEQNHSKVTSTSDLTPKPKTIKKVDNHDFDPEAVEKVIAAYDTPKSSTSCSDKENPKKSSLTPIISYSSNMPTMASLDDSFSTDSSKSSITRSTINSSQHIGSKSIVANHSPLVASNNNKSSTSTQSDLSDDSSSEDGIQSENEYVDDDDDDDVIIID